MAEVDLGKYRTRNARIFSGRDRGEEVRRAAGLDSLDIENDVTVVVRVPEDVISVNSSFFLGMFGASIAVLGNEGFRARYRFTGGDISETVDDRVAEVLRRKSPLAEHRKP